jgi:hypothetical protein
VCEAELLFSGKDSNKDEFVTAGGTTAPSTVPRSAPCCPLISRLTALVLSPCCLHTALCPLLLLTTEQASRGQASTRNTCSRSACPVSSSQACFPSLDPPPPHPAPPLLAWHLVTRTPPLFFAWRLLPRLPLLLAGELLDVDGVTGGHNFQSCWTTGMVAGTEAAKVALALAATETAAPPPTSTDYL